MAERKVKVVNPNKRIILELQLFTVKKKGEKEKAEGRRRLTSSFTDSIQGRKD